jgi:formamidopyrimidine-DNA glycosylase
VYPVPVSGVWRNGHTLPSLHPGLGIAGAGSLGAPLRKIKIQERFIHSIEDVSMPELPEVESYRKYFEATSLQDPIAEIDVKSPAILRNISEPGLRRMLVGKSFTSVSRRGKYLNAFIGKGKSALVLHFGMTGFLAHFHDLDMEPGHDRLLITFGNGTYLAFDDQRNFGGVFFADDVQEFFRKKNLGPDALDISLDEFLNLLETRRRQIKPLLMDQTFISGIGNIYSDEILYQAGVHPLTTSDTLDPGRKKELYQAMRTVLETAVERNAEFDRYPEDWLLKHRSEGAECPRRDCRVEKISISGRSSYFCPCNQKLPRK